MRIGFDNVSPGDSTGRQAPGGMRMTLQSWLTEMAAQAPQHQFVVFTPDWADPLLDGDSPANVQVVRLPGVPRRRPLRILYQQTGLIAAIERQRLDAFFAMATVAPLLSRVPVVLAVQFIQFYEMPEAYGHLRTAYLRRFLPLSLRKARHAFIFSETSRRDLIRYTGADPDKVHVVPHGLSANIWRLAALPPGAPEWQVGKTLTGGRPYILYVSSTYGYKNHARLIRAFGWLKQRQQLPHVLLLVGSEMAVTFDELRSVAGQSGVLPDVILAGRLDHDRAVATYLGADLSVIPTLYETFGYPALEAMACGCPVVTSNFGSMSELASDAAILVDPHDEVAIADAMARVLDEPNLRQTLVERGRRRVAQYTWTRSAARVLELLESAART